MTEEPAAADLTSSVTMITQADLVLTRGDGKMETLRLGAFIAPVTMHMSDGKDGMPAISATLDVGAWLREGARLLEAGAEDLRRQAAIADEPSRG